MGRSITDTICVHLQINKSVVEAVHRYEPGVKLGVLLNNLLREHIKHHYYGHTASLSTLEEMYSQECGHIPDIEEKWLLDIILSFTSSTASAIVLLDGLCSRVWLHRVVRVASKGIRENAPYDAMIQSRLNTYMKKGVIWE